MGVSARTLRSILTAAAIGDALGYRAGAIEFSSDAGEIERQLSKLGGKFSGVKLKLPEWRVSDDTVQHLATVGAVCEAHGRGLDAILQEVATRHVSSWRLMGARAPGNTCRMGVKKLRSAGPAAWKTAVEFTRAKNSGCGAAMRAMGLGAVYADDQDMLVKVAAETAALSHHSVAGCASAVISAAGTSLALRGVPTAEWPGIFVDEYLARLKDYLRSRGSGRAVSDGKLLDARLALVAAPWEARRGGESDGGSSAAASASDMSPVRDTKTRDERFRALGHGWDAISAVVIAWDALHAAEDDWDTMLKYAIVHGGDSDSTGTIAAAWFAASRGEDDSDWKEQGEDVEFRSDIDTIGSLWSSSGGARG